MSENGAGASSGGILETMGAEIVEDGEGRSKIRFPWQPAFTIPNGQIQGGVFGVLMDMAMAIAADGLLATVSMQVTLLRPVFEGTVTVTGEVVRSGRRIVYAEAEVRDEEGRLVARGSQTAVALDSAPGREAGAAS